MVNQARGQALDAWTRVASARTRGDESAVARVGDVRCVKGAGDRHGRWCAR
ncbi:hypothetical protein CRG98_004830 [Punica granatum]|uniref:Uncharacterized protein n=1 Tax=Punica granatum TaxID=22663 RepID=A0A2I0L276_PUNGR|nr:hypothetical protein CRG98_004830 [Punica granatum]